MAPKHGSAANASSLANGLLFEERWMNVMWMPHASLSPKAHVHFVVRSFQCSLNDWGEQSRLWEWKVHARVYGIGGLPLVSTGCDTPSALLRQRDDRQRSSAGPCVANASHDCIWNHVVQLPIRWRDLPRDAHVLFEIISHDEQLVAQVSMPFFNEDGRMATGLRRLKMKPQESYQAQSRLPSFKSIEDPCSSVSSEDVDSVWKATCVLDQLDRFEVSKPGSVSNLSGGIGKGFDRIPCIPWLDEITKGRCQNVLNDSKYRSVGYDDGNALWYLIIELPTFDVPIMHEESFYPISNTGASGAASPRDLSLYQKTSVEGDTSFNALQLVRFTDYENEMDNPVEDKYRTLAHDLLRGLVDPALKPDRVQRDRLAAIIASPSHHPSREEKDLLWRFRFSLVDNRKALTKFLLAVDWTVESEVVQAAELLEQWRKRSPIEVTDALKLLGKHVAFQTNLVRAYAIDTLTAAPDSELRLYLLQLVQALKYETFQGSDHKSPTKVTGLSSEQNRNSASRISSLASFLIDRAAGNLSLANYLYWYLKVELQDPSHGTRYAEVLAELKIRLSNTPFKVAGKRDTTEKSGIAKHAADAFFSNIVDSAAKLSSSFRGTDGVGVPDEQPARSNKQHSVWDVLVAQDNFISGVMDVQQRCRDFRGKRDAKEAQLQELLSKEGYGKQSGRTPVPLPSSPHLLVNGVKPKTAKMFKSALYPALLDFHVEVALSEKHHSGHPPRARKSKESGSYSGTVNLSSYKVIVKTGDDLRQDQLVIMMIQLMDGLLKRAALDLCLMPYSIIATSPTSGLVEFVDGSSPISGILSEYNGSILQFFRSYAPQEGAKFGVRPDVLSTYIRSCAGYCVITYILGVGDRHLDNILLDKKGHFFHIDFGFIFGRDPKPLPPAFRLTREMVEGMGGLDSPQYRQFCSLACQAYNALRKSAGLVLNLLHLMSDAGIEDLSNNPSADPDGVIAKVEERFRLDLTDEQAERYFLGLVNDCLAAIAPRVMDVFHSLAVARR